MAKDWKDELSPVIGGAVAQFAALRLVDWAKTHQADNTNAQRLIENHFFFLPQIIAVVLIVITVKLARRNIDLRGLEFRDWLGLSALFVMGGITLIGVGHLDQLFALGASAFPESFFADGVKGFADSDLYGFLQTSLAVRFVFDLTGLLLIFVGIRKAKPVSQDVRTARLAEKLGDWVGAGDSYLKAGDVPSAKKAFRKGKAPVRLAALELREGDARAAAKLYEEAGAAYSWEAAKAWEAAGEMQKAMSAKQAALAEARASSRWYRMAAVAAVLGDSVALADATRRLAELGTGVAKSGLWKRAAETAKSVGRSQEAAEAYRASGDHLVAAELFLGLGKPLDAAQEFERGGDLARAAAAMKQAGNEKAAFELLARDAEGKGDLPRAAEAWFRSGQIERAAGLYERAQLFPQAAYSWRQLKKPEKAAPLYQRAGDLPSAAVCFEEANLPDKAAVLYRDLQNHAKAAVLFRVAGKLADAAASFEAIGQYEDAVGLFRRAGKVLDAARCALLMGQREKAWEFISTAPRNDPNVRAFFNQLAAAHLQFGEVRDAIHVLLEVLGTSAVNAETQPAYEMLVRAYIMSGDRREAAELAARIGMYDPTYNDRQSRTVITTQETHRMAAPHTPTPPRTQRAPSGLYQAAPSTPPASSPRPASGLFQGAPPPAPPRPASGLFAGTPASVAAGQPTAVRGASGSYVQPAPVPPPMPSSGPVSMGSSTSIPVQSGMPFPAERPEDRYQVVSELGRGGMGVVHKALDRKLDRYVALKILPWQLRGDEMAMRYFAREARSIAAMKHPNIVALYDYGEGFGSVYLAMEFLEGPNLQSLLKANPEMIRVHWRQWFVQAARGVAAAHAKGILHRDIKPANLMLDEHGTVRILDFGLARGETDSGATSKLIGTPAFFPPELLRGEPPTPAADVYSLGATFYTLATGRWPYMGDDMLVARLEREPEDPRRYAPSLTEDESYVLLRSLSRLRQDRYPDGGELLAALLCLEA